MNIKKITGKIIRTTDLSNTAKEVSVDLSESIDFIPGSFFNIFLDINGEKIRRAYSIASSYSNKSNVTFTIRLSPSGVMTPYIWNNDMVGRSIELMGPLGLNTVDKMNHNKVYLFAFGVGAGVVKSIADYFSIYKKVDSLVIITGSRNPEEILHKEYFDKLAENSINISVLHVVSKTSDDSLLSKGYIQDFIDDLDFNDSDVYVCGQEKACNDLVSKINYMNPKDCSFFIEGFH